jgi:hypothetical protein
MRSDCDPPVLRVSRVISRLALLRRCIYILSTIDPTFFSVPSSDLIPAFFLSFRNAAYEHAMHSPSCRFATIASMRLRAGDIGRTATWHRGMYHILILCLRYMLTCCWGLFFNYPSSISSTIIPPFFDYHSTIIPPFFTTLHHSSRSFTTFSIGGLPILCLVRTV